MGIKHCIRALGAPLFKNRTLHSPETEQITVSLPHLPTAFNGFRIAVVSDLHLPDCLSSPAQIIRSLREQSPDCIVLAGDLTNRYHHTDERQLYAFLQEINAIAPTFAIAGNHERAPHRFATFRALLETAHIPLLKDAYTTLEKDGNTLTLYGVFDPHLPLPTTVPSPAILLVHYPHRAVKQADSGFSLAVCGHAHGGQMRIFKRGLFAPGQGFFAKYVSGLYHIGNMQMVVSRGLGDSSLPIRIHNRPHLPIIILHNPTALYI